MKNIILTGLIISMMQVACARQMQPRTPQQRAAHKTQVLTRKLELTEGQATKANTVFLRQALQMDSLKAQTKLHRRQARQQIISYTDEQMRHILTPEQETEYAAWKQAKKEKRKARHTG